MYRKIICVLFLYIPIASYCQTGNYSAEIPPNAVFVSGVVKLNDATPKPAMLFFSRTEQRLYVLKEDKVSKYSASEVASFLLQTDRGTVHEQEKLFISWKFKRDWPSYEKMTFFEVLGDFHRCALVAADRYPRVTDAYPDSSEVFVAQITQGISYYIILPGGKVVPYERNTIDHYLEIILESDYSDVMRYAFENGLRSTRLEDLITILRFAAQLQ
ncbi:hypothetical protein [Fulvivirga sedimenti]|uniref:Uncharacterized protein n=1 Tax=Fulvivirga sedimenti TaxID=2879465 RepID=A0A9X1HNA7_9BACT|nr:hypothetical protein [Fulvivirga sedimenti]MCA6073737.1 hypothetical protein [Fulvivirga sedimenti]